MYKSYHSNLTYNIYSLFCSYQCPFCYATGENAHTRRYCPKNPNKMCFIKGEQLAVKQNLQ